MTTENEHNLQSKPERVLRLRLSGMHCSACSARIEKYLNSVDEVENASVSLATNTASIHFKNSIEDDFDFHAFANTSIERIKNMGFEAEVLAFPESKVSQTQALNSIDKDAQKETLQSGKNIQERALPHYIVEAEKELKTRQKSLIIEVVLASIVMIVAMGSHFGIPMPAFLDMHTSPVNFVLVQFFLTVPVLWLGRNFYKVGFRSLMQGAPNMDTLVALGTGAAFLYSVWSTYHVLIAQNSHELHMALMGIYYESAAMLIALISFGKYMELRSKRKTHDAIRSLMDLSPATATLVQNYDGTSDIQSATLVEVSVEQIKVGDYIFLKSGNQIPVDGIVCEGIASLDVSALTGEFMPITAEKGQSVSSGSLCVGAPFYMQAERVGADTVLSKIIALVEEAQGSKAPIAQLADFVSLYFVPFVISFACLAGLLWYFIGDLPFVQSLKIFVAVMVVACPCALGLATPMSIMVATGRAAKLGLLIKNGTVLELAGKIDAIVFDKTGTLTIGKPSLAQEYICKVQSYKENQPSERFENIETIDSIENIDEDKNQKAQKIHETFLMQIASALEKNSDHPISKAFLEFSKNIFINSKDGNYSSEINDTVINNTVLDFENIHFQEFEEVSGRGLYALLNIENKSIPYYMGNRAFMLEKGIVFSEEENALYAQILEEGKSPLLFGQGAIQESSLENLNHASSSINTHSNESVAITSLATYEKSIYDTPQLLAVFSITDTIREESKLLIAELQSHGIATYLLSGDNKTSVQKLANKIGIEAEYVTAEVMPSDKEACIVDLQKKHKVVAMVGDGINDAPALARAHVGMVMGSGMDVAMEAGDIVLLGGISGVLTTLRLSHATILNIKISLFWAFFYNCLLLPVAAGLLLLFGGPTLSPMLAGAAMSLSSFSVVTNALRLRSFK